MGKIAKAGVVGAGVMGAGIAGQLANAGISVELLDLNEDIAAAGIARETNAGGLADATAASRIRAGSMTSHLERLSQVDWIVEAAAEQYEVKSQILAAVDSVRKPGSIVSSSTSTILLSKLIQGRAARFAGDFLITHFFNPPRLMRLVELVSAPATRPDAVATITNLIEVELGKVVVACRDTPGFIANRIGSYWMAAAFDGAVREQLDVEEADAIIGKPFGTPAGIFAMLDVVGIDVASAAWRSLHADLPSDDPLQAYAAEPPLLAAMLAQGRKGRKTGGGFMRKRLDGGLDTLDLETGAYREARPVVSATVEAAAGSLCRIMSEDSPGGRFASGVMERTLAYAAALVPEIADTPAMVDRAMRHGYGWREGPFQLIDRIGAAWLVERLETRGVSIVPLLQDAATRGSFYGNT